MSALSAPPTSGSFDKDLDNDIRRDAYQSSSGNSSPQREEEEAAAPSAAAAGDLNFHVDDIEMWEVLEALDGAPLAMSAPPGSVLVAGRLWGRVLGTKDL